jgi:hypothetical protein
VEVDCVQELPGGVRLIEIKSSETLSVNHIKNIGLLKKLFAKTEDFIIYAGKEEALYHNVKFVRWQNMEKITNNS